jgi:Ner family transcriptional regulator
MQANSPPAVQPDMAKADIAAALKKAGLSQEGLSAKHGLTKSAVSVALCKRWPSVEKIIAEAIGIPAHRIWPSRYASAVPIKRGAAAVSKRRNRGATLLNNRPGSGANGKRHGDAA